ncbi:S-layer homology domain-containing protein [Gracilibacillus xinjiangensis]|uniref:S-layer homology domain-containing protein n=1 Tax=Gracilibacillus xinjiangensis TaxID=1193282 RepID=A0ABV8WW88_9BACI
MRIIDLKKLLAFLLFTALFLSNPLSSLAFDDLEKVPWAEDEINALYKQNIINGVNSTEFAPNRSITRAEATQLIVSANFKDEIVEYDSSFSDVNDQYFYKDVIDIATAKGVITGYPDGTFRPKHSITRAEASVIINNAYSINLGSTKRSFSDLENSHWAEVAMTNLSSNRLINGYPDGTIRPSNEITRAEFAVILKTVLDYKNGIIPEETETTYEEEVVRLTNIERANHGLAPLEMDAKLTEVAELKSADMRDNNYFAHTSPTYGSPFNMMDQFDIQYLVAAENIAAGQRTPEEVVNSWMNSEGHRANILREEITHIGVGYVEGGSYNTYWTQMFIKKAN